MGVRFHRSFSIVPGFRLNLSKSGLSTSIGRAPLTLNIGRRGLMGTASIPGTGISFRRRIFRRGKTHNGILSLLIIPGLICLAISGLINSLGEITAGVISVVAVALIIWLVYAKRQARRDNLLSKYANPTVVKLILKHRFWQGQTAAQLIDSLGNPHGIDRKMLKTMKREVWKYAPRGVNRYGLRIILDNDIVSTWDQKQ